MRKVLAILLAIAISVVPMAAFAAPTSAAEVLEGISMDLPEESEVLAESGVPYKSGSDKYLYFKLAKIKIGPEYEDGYCKTSGHINYYMELEGPGEKIDLTSKESVLAAYEKTNGDFLDEFDESYDIPLASEFTVLENKDGEIQLRYDYSDEETAILYLTPIYSGCWRLIKMYSENEDAGFCDKIALSYTESDKALDAMIDSMLERAGNGNSVGMSYGKWFGALVLAALLIFTIWWNRKAIRREKRLIEEARRTGHPKEEDLTGKKKIMLTCINCKKEFEVYVEPMFEEMTRKNTTRCPECKKEMDKRMEYIDRHTRFSGR